MSESVILGRTGFAGAHLRHLPFGWLLGPRRVAVKPTWQ